MKHRRLRAAIARMLSLRKRRKKCTDCIDGGVRHFVDDNLPKQIRSTQIDTFYCWFSSMSRMLCDTPIAGQVFTLTATRESCTCKIRDRGRETTSVTFTPDADFFSRLQDIICRYNMVQENGRHHHVSGLPPDFGIDLQVRYASGETLITSDNQSCFLSNQAMEELAALFQQTSS